MNAQPQPQPQPQSGPRSPILIAYDGSTAARVAVAQAGVLFAPRRAILLTVWEPGLSEFMLAPDPMGMGTTMLPYDPELGQEIDRASEEHAQDIAADGVALAQAAGLAPEPMAVADELSVADTVLDAAEQHGAAAIVVGSRGLRGLRSKLLGSTSRAVLERSSLPVVVVRHPEDQSEAT
jgi:nucleotide-binding universal stress UspA family protein